MEEIDRVCGAAVALLSTSMNAGIMDVLGWIGTDRLAAVILALPAGRRRTIASRDPVWVRAWATVDLDAVEEVSG